MDLTCSFHSWEEAKNWAAPIRLDVFVREQNIPEEEEWDEADLVSLHGLAWFGGKAVACIRLLPDGKIGRLAVLQQYRRRKVASRLFQACLEQARLQGFGLLRLSAQKSAMKLYEDFGFKPVGADHMEVGIPHQWMEKQISQ